MVDITLPTLNVVADAPEKQIDSSSGSFQSGSYVLRPPDGTPIPGDEPQPVFIQPRGALAGIYADAIVRESGRDNLRLTDSPVERSADITDHAIVEPVELEVELGYTNSGHGFGYSAAVYEAVLALQKARQPFSFTTGKRIYANMLITSVSQTTDEKSENSLMLHVTMREVILVAVTYTSLPPMNQQAMPDRTAGTVSTGDKQLMPVDPGKESTLTDQLFGNGGGYTQATGSVLQR